MSQKAKWTGKGQSGEIAAWAGDGSCEILSYDNAKAGFGVGTEDKGPAVHVQFAASRENGPKFDAWVSPAELEQA